ncbi:MULTISPECIES: phosphoribosylformylglycinamidine synthase subunit PurQ [unclassified Psychrobacter]|uniref:phosphoribosylformylglycinamidine synthase subunit PurQ n=1 Tax=unclassified Psychrobacter TaxID=196806 RepID=UPI0025B2A710|nr:MULTISPECIES: phosphoribosylformylglycinamidine synthase subunit PurQ [unclassified Psychrobacter]MDN3453058.1 phosphoribosylformylglycinamidine synthase subunit PurQ [Psychrobacter sp. APC 3350]MDN3501455.1 phosphoribosylformylglycinamidine synthase subunit PurQ [Psychrobacter sp. 5A.1]
MLRRTYTNVWTLVEYLADYPIETYPLNPNGSVGGVTDLCSIDGRVAIMRPHPECHLKAYS